MRVLVACEYSGTVRDAFAALGHDAMSCDLLPTESLGPHYQGDVFDVLNDGWDLMIAHPPCTYLSNAGIGYFNISRYGEKAINRWVNRIEATKLFMRLWRAPIEKICIENPVGFLNSTGLKAHQIIEPWYFGDPHKKRTCLWLKNLPLLKYSFTDTLFEKATSTPEPEPIFIDNSGTARFFTDSIKGHGGGYHGRQKARSKTFTSIAQAMANQWGNNL